MKPETFYQVQRAHPSDYYHNNGPSNWRKQSNHRDKPAAYRVANGIAADGDAARVVKVTCEVISVLPPKRETK